MEKMVRQSPSMEILPMDILYNIFLRLPVKCLLRFKSVCKSWLFILTSRHFANLHLRCNSLSSERLLIFAGEDHSLYSVSLNNPESTAIKIPFPSTWGRFSRKKIVGSCNGLLLCLCDESTDSEALLINPSTLPQKRIPKLQIPQQTMYVTYGFGYDGLVDDYKIVRIVHYMPYKMEVMVDVYSLSSDLWKVVDRMSPLLGTPTSQNGALVNDHLLHWLFHCPSTNKHQIACFDVCHEKWTEMPTPDYSRSVSISPVNNMSDPEITTQYDIIDLGALDGCLCLLTRNYHRQFGDVDVWVMKEYRVEESWVKLFDISDLQVIGSFRFTPITKEGSKILLKRDLFSHAFWYDVTEEWTEIAEFHGLPDYRQVSVCMLSLVTACANGRIGCETSHR